MFDLLFESEERCGSVGGKHGVVRVCAHPSGITLDGLVILSFFEMSIALVKKEQNINICYMTFPLLLLAVFIVPFPSQPRLSPDRM